ncbi:MerR family transcriptional regulator [Roseibium aggregatum]|uniref:MerR family transcriptional regulator n=1 Tax=Roseibium aggregatum TaxID=187304 RepID=A0A926S492_9HYPH|nr:MerR family transcriptional regulator [Roseibium aggregatum]MBD1545166.1 MerR family transcriptional regulator [Roseibium aggregatum]
MVSQFKPRPLLRSENYTISDLVERYDTSLRTLRFYEQHGLVQPARPKPNTRVYSRADVERLDFVFDCRLTGMSVRAIASLLRLRDTLPGRDFDKAHARELRNRLSELLQEREQLEEQKQALERGLGLLEERLAS